MSSLEEGTDGILTLLWNASSKKGEHSVYTALTKPDGTVRFQEDFFRMEFKLPSAAVADKFAEMFARQAELMRGNDDLTIGWELDERGNDDFFVIDKASKAKLTSAMTLQNAQDELRSMGGTPPPEGGEIVLMPFPGRR